MCKYNQPWSPSTIHSFIYFSYSLIFYGTCTIFRLRFDMYIYLADEYFPIPSRRQWSLEVWNLPRQCWQSPRWALCPAAMFEYLVIVGHIILPHKPHEEAVLKERRPCTQFKWFVLFVPTLGRNLCASHYHQSNNQFRINLNLRLVKDFYLRQCRYSGCPTVLLNQK